MFHFVSKRAILLGFLFLFTASFNQVFSQQSSLAALGKSENDPRSDNVSKSEPNVSGDPIAIIASFVAAENRVREALNQHTFKRDVVLQTIGPNGEVTGEYIRNSQFLFDDRGRRIEKVLFHPGSTIREMRITKEDIQDLAGAQLLGIDIVEATKYRLTYAGTETIGSQQLFAIDVTPTTEPDPKRMKERFFVGRVWVDPNTFQIVKIKGIVEPQGKQRFPIFETWREPSKNALAFPTRTEADDVLHFGALDVHYRIRVRYYEYKQFGSKVSITEIDGPDVDTNEVPPTRKDAPPTLKPARPVSNDASPKMNEASPKVSERSANKLPLLKTEPRDKQEVCTTNRNAPPVGGYHWPANSDVKVYFTRGMFTSEQSVVLLEAMKTWNVVGAENGSGVRFLYAGETDSRMSCRGCLTVTRREVYKHDRHHYAFFHPMQERAGGLLVSAWIDLDVGITEPKALQGFMAHELGHGLGLWDCPSCKNKRSLMSSFPGLNKNNGLIAPSTCDVATMKSVYQGERQIALAKSSSDQRPESTPTDSTAALSVPVPIKTESPVIDLQRTLVGGAATRSSSDKQTELVAVDRPLLLPSPLFANASFLAPRLQSLTAVKASPAKSQAEKNAETVRSGSALSRLGPGKSSLHFFYLQPTRTNSSIFLWDRGF